MFTISLPNKIDNLITISLGLYFFIPSHIFFLGVGYYTHTYIYIDINKYIGNRQPPKKNAIVSCRFSCDRQGYWSLAYPGYAYAMPACAGYAGTGSSVEHGGAVADHGKMLGTHGKCWENVCLNPWQWEIFQKIQRWICAFHEHKVLFFISFALEHYTYSVKDVSWGKTKYDVFFLPACTK